MNSQAAEISTPNRDFPVKTGASCGYCRGKVDVLGCVGRCERSENGRIDFTAHLQTDKARLAAITSIVERVFSQTKPEFISPEFKLIYQLAKRPH
jgi:hypothetical protein